MANAARAGISVTEQGGVARDGWRLDRYFTGVITAIDCYFNAIDPSGISACQKHRKPSNVFGLTGSALCRTMSSYCAAPSIRLKLADNVFR